MEEYQLSLTSVKSLFLLSEKKCLRKKECPPFLSRARQHPERGGEAHLFLDLQPQAREETAQRRRQSRENGGEDKLKP